MSKRNAHYYQHKKLKRRKKHLAKIFSTTCLSVMSFSIILYTFLIVDKRVDTINLQQVHAEITELQADVAYLEGKYEEITNTISATKKLKTTNETLNKNIQKQQTTIENLEIQISKMEK